MKRPRSPELRLEMRLRNNRLLEVKEASGLSATRFYEEVGVNPTMFSELVTMKTSPIKKNGEWRKDALRLANYARMLPEDLFPEAVRAVRKPRAELKLTAHDVRAFMPQPSDPQRRVEQRQLREVVAKILGTIPPREERLLRMRYGLDGNEPMTLTEASQVLDVSVQRARQIEDRALGRLRYPSRRQRLLQAKDGLLPEEVIEHPVNRGRRCQSCGRELTGNLPRGVVCSECTGTPRYVELTPKERARADRKVREQVARELEAEEQRKWEQQQRAQAEADKWFDAL